MMERRYRLMFDFQCGSSGPCTTPLQLNLRLANLMPTINLLIDKLHLDAQPPANPHTERPTPVEINNRT
jgi:hypothetical protein